MENNFSHTFNITGIYMIHNTISKKSYIGSAVNIYKRIFGKSSWSHLKSLSENRHINKHLQSAYNKHGVSVFTFRILEICNKELLLEREQFYLDTKLCAKEPKKFRKKAYNICPVAGSPLGRKMNSTFKKKCSLSKAGSKNPMFGKKGINHPNNLKIIQYDSNGVFMSVFNNVTEASELLSISQNSIRNSIQKGYMGGEYYWKRFSINFPLKITIKKQLKKRISAICLNSNKMYVFNSFAEAALFFNKERKVFSNAIRNAIVKKNGIYKNYIWKEN
jgi:group I intron endonuclease